MQQCKSNHLKSLRISTRVEFQFRVFISYKASMPILRSSAIVSNVRDIIVPRGNFDLVMALSRSLPSCSQGLGGNIKSKVDGNYDEKQNSALAIKLYSSIHRTEPLSISYWSIKQHQWKHWQLYK